VHHRAKDITGLRVGYLTALSYHGSDGRKSLWNARCDCGKVVVLAATELKKQKSRGIKSSCGCRRKQTIGEKNTTHGMSAHPAYAVWRSMLNRCLLDSHHAWKDYGGRGIEVCSRWRESFDAFWGDMGRTYRRGLSLDRVENSQGYSPENCAWKTARQQANNTRRTRFLDTPLGRFPFSEAARIYKVGRSTLAYRLDAGWPLPVALTAPRGSIRDGSTISLIAGQGTSSL
jgi:hypothetical protein